MGFIVSIIALFIVVSGASLFLPARKARKRDQALEAWPTAKGTVISTTVVPQPLLTTDPDKQVQQFDVSVKYQFRSGGQLHFGSSITYPRYLFEQDEAERIAACYPAGAAVTIHHNPDDIQECYLELRKTAKHYKASLALIVVGGVLFVSGCLAGLLLGV
jgi:hypothetical protein